MAKINVVNESTSVTDDQVAVMAEAVSIQIKNHFAPAWNQMPSPVTWVKKDQVDPDAWVVTVLDNTHELGTLGYHEQEGAAPTAKVFCQPSLDYGSSVFTGDYAISSILSHECLELLTDPTTTEWNLVGVDHHGNATFVAEESVDPVESQYYEIHVDGTRVNVSNFVLPAWFDPQTDDLYTDILRTITKPLTIASGGYVITWDHQGQQATFGHRIPIWRIEHKSSVGSRSYYRMITELPHHHFRRGR